MSMLKLANRCLVEVGGRDAMKYLQGLTTNDISFISSAGSSQATVFLNTKGRVICDGLVTNIGAEKYLLDVSKSVSASLMKHMKFYKLKSKVSIVEKSDELCVIVSRASFSGEKVVNHEQIAALNAIGTVAPPCQDPRTAALGSRAIGLVSVVTDSIDAAEDPSVEEQDYKLMRLLHGVPEGSEIVDKIPLECNFDLLPYISFNKGCYLGQELTARTFFKGVVRKRLLPFVLSSAVDVASSTSLCSDDLLLHQLAANPSAPLCISKGSSVVSEDGIDIGEVIAMSCRSVGLMMLRLEAIAGSAGIAVKSTGEKIVPLFPSWWPKDLDLKTGKVHM